MPAPTLYQRFCYHLPLAAMSRIVIIVVGVVSIIPSRVVMNSFMMCQMVEIDHFHLPLLIVETRKGVPPSPMLIII